tara:strand:+ start:55 stop:162 length:108 start_codon:yes stop_codon:yes gene_type:complete
VNSLSLITNEKEITEQRENEKTKEYSMKTKKSGRE